VTHLRHKMSIIN